MSTFYIDKDDGSHIIYRDTRDRKGTIAYGKESILGKFVEMMACSLNLQKDGETIIIRTRLEKNKRR